MRDLINRSVKVNILLVLIAFLVFVILHRFSFAFGLLVGASWSTVNLVLTIKLIEIAILQRDKQKLLLLLLIKFPVLYLLGFLILIYKIFPISSLFLGVFSILLVLGVLSICIRKASTNCQI